MAEVLTATPPHDTSRSTSPFLDPDPLRHTSSSATTFSLNRTNVPRPTQSSFYESFNTLGSDDESSSASSSPRFDAVTSLESTPPSSISLDRREDDEDDEEEDGLCFPSYGDPLPMQRNTEAPPATPESDSHTSTSPPTPINPSLPNSPLLRPADDSAVHEEPTRQVDYLSHSWTEEDVSVSWRHIVSNRKTFGERSRLENASWRTWTKSKYRLRTVEPEKLNWMKDCDVTWLYGPLQEAHQVNRIWVNKQLEDCKERRDSAVVQSEPASNLSKNNSFLKKPILKKRSVSEVMLQKSLSSSSLIKDAATAIQAQRLGRPALARSTSAAAASTDFTNGIRTAPLGSKTHSVSSSGLQSPTEEKKHIRFDDKVKQCIAVDFKTDQSHISNSWTDDEPSSSEEELIMMKRGSSRQLGNSAASSRRNSLGQEGSGIAMLPSTTLKFHHDEPYCPGHPSGHSTPGSSSGRLSHSVSQETLRPANPATNFLLDEDDDMSWEPSGAFGGTNTPKATDMTGDEPIDVPSGLRRTPSGMFMPFDDEHDPGLDNVGVFGRVVNTVNTARDIFSVIYNVGWRN